MTLETLLSELRYKEEIEAAVLHKIRRDEKKIAEIADSAYQGEDLNFTLCKRMPLTRLAVVTYLLLRKYDDYREKRTPDSVIFDTFRDVSLRANLYFDRTGGVGISKEDVIWFRHLMNVGIFKIGSLQFQPFEMIYLDEETIGEPYMTFSKEQKEILPAGSRVLNCHIQQGADLRPEAVKESFRGARQFFSAPYKAVLCYSWLLYPPMVKRLPYQSDIKQFAANFTVIGAFGDPEQAMEYLLGRRSKKELPLNATMLQKLAFEHKELFGIACGVIVL